MAWRLGVVLYSGWALSRAEVEQLWARDRAALSRCGLSLEAVVRFYEDLGRRLDKGAGT